MRNIVVAASAIVAALSLQMAAAAEGGAAALPIPALYDLKGQLQDVVNKSIKGVAEAMEEGPPAQGSEESWIDYYNRRQRHYQQLYAINDQLLQAQKKLLSVNLQLMTQLPKDDPRHSQIQTEIINISNGMGATTESRDKYKAKAAEFKNAIEDYHRKRGAPPPAKSGASPSPNPGDSQRGEAGTGVDPAAAAAIGAVLGIGVGTAISRGGRRPEGHGRGSPGGPPSRCHRNPMTGQAHCGRG
jgi:hypothetical protein